MRMRRVGCGARCPEGREAQRGIVGEDRRDTVPSDACIGYREATLFGRIQLIEIDHKVFCG